MMWSEGFNRALRKIQREKEEETTNFRQRYYSIAVGERAEFRKSLETLVQASEPFFGYGLKVLVNSEENWHAQDGSDSFTIRASLTPTELLAVIDEWDKAEEQVPGFPIGVA
jgi:hypothetical protein